MRYDLHTVNHDYKLCEIVMYGIVLYHYGERIDRFGNVFFGKRCQNNAVVCNVAKIIPGYITIINPIRFILQRTEIKRLNRWHYV